MLLFMRTTVDIDDALLNVVKSRAARDRKTLKAVVEQALRAFLTGEERAVAGPPPIPVFQGRGVQPGVDLADNASLEDLMNAEC